MAYLGEYIEVGWENEPSQRTPVNAYNLGIMEDGIKRLFAYLIAGGGIGPGTDGREVELRNSGEYIQWRYSGEEDWTNLVSLADLKGEKGDDYVLTDEDIEEIASKVKVETSADKITYDDTETKLGTDNVQGAIGKLSEQISDILENGTGTTVTSGSVKTILSNIMTIMRAQINPDGTPQVYNPDISAIADMTDELIVNLGTTEEEPEIPDDVTLSSISVIYTGGSVPVGTALSSLRGLTVTATYSDGSKASVSGYTLSGEIVEGSNTITVTYKGMTDTFTVTGVAQSENVNVTQNGSTLTIIDVPNVTQNGTTLLIA